MKILLTNRELCQLGGSELVTVELAEEFGRQGHDVTVYTPRTGDLIDTSHLNVVTEKPNTADFDLLWIHHNLLVYDLGFKKREGQKIVFNHMSSYVQLEWPQIASYQNGLADLTLANSEETRDKLVALGLESVKLFQNPAPKCFESLNRSSDYGLFVSNHRPLELYQATRDLGIECKFIGGEDMERITPDHMAGAAFVVCNGKSTQYAMRARVPVFLYDHFFGSGWDFMAGEYWNFSGRGVPKADLSELSKWTQQGAGTCPERFKLELCLQELLELKTNL